MNLEELYALLSGTGIPFAYHHWNEPPAPPFGVYLTPYSNNFAADDVAYLEVEHVEIELYTEKRDIEAERRIADALTGAGFYFEKSATFVEALQLYQTVFEIEV